MIETEAGTARVIVLETTLQVGSAVFDRSIAHTWKGWDEILAAVRKLDPAISADELRMLQSLPTTNSGKAGFAEMCSALRGMGKMPV